MIKLDKNTINDLESRKVKKIKIFFYDAWCSGTKINISEDFEIDQTLMQVNISSKNTFKIYIDKRDKEKLKNCSITKTINKDHTWEEKIRYIFSSKQVKSRCWCWSSFDLWDKKPKLNINNLNNLKLKFKK